jgi:toxin ParE1/3/4
MRYRLSDLAEGDLREAWVYVATEASVGAADRLIDAIFERFELLASQPRMGRSRTEFGEGVRSLAVDSYVIYYRDDAEPLIARVLHGRRDQRAAWDQTTPVARELRSVAGSDSGSCSVSGQMVG